MPHNPRVGVGYHYVLKFFCNESSHVIREVATGIEVLMHPLFCCNE